VVPHELLTAADVVVPNRVELGRLAGTAPPETAQAAVQLVSDLAVRSTVVTLGSEGAVVVHDGRVTEIPSPVIKAVDTTAAGDAFCGALADALARGESLEDAAWWGTRVAAVACTKPGAQDSLPTREAVLAS
jgi:ribokinase